VDGAEAISCRAFEERPPARAPVQPRTAPDRLVPPQWTLSRTDPRLRSKGTRPAPDHSHRAKHWCPVAKSPCFSMGLSMAAAGHRDVGSSRLRRLGRRSNRSPATLLCFGVLSPTCAGRAARCSRTPGSPPSLPRDSPFVDVPGDNLLAGAGSSRPIWWRHFASTSPTLIPAHRCPDPENYGVAELLTRAGRRDRPRSCAVDKKPSSSRRPPCALVGRVHVHRKCSRCGARESNRALAAEL